VELFVRKNTQPWIKISASQHIYNMNYMNYDHKMFLGYLNFSQAIENSIWIAQRDIVEK